MRLPVSWLREWVEVDADPERIALCLTMRGFYVETIEHFGHSYPGVVVGRVLEVMQHPNADRLSLCRVDSGAGEVRVVCGAPNVVPGMLAPLATVGARLPGGTVIKKSKIRGEESFGMLCSPRELDLADDHEGILDLTRMAPASTLTPGQPLDEVLPPPDHVLEVEVPFNRPDGLGVVGLAREARAGLDGRWTKEGRSRLEARAQIGGGFDLELEDREGCPRYIAQVIENVKVTPSPPWLVRRMLAMGQRSLGNVVDLTNLILLEMGQPVHAFDLARLSGPAIRVRRARAEERLTTLDGVERKLDPEILVIADRERPVGLAGVMGGLDTEVTEGTTTILLECAWFDPRRVRIGARALGLATEASRRFERGADSEIGEVAVARFVSLLAELSPGARVGKGKLANHPTARPRPIDLRPSRCTRLLGVEVSPEAARTHLEAMNFTVTGSVPLKVEPPSWRPDVTLEDDLVEEVGRAHGYDRIPEAAPRSDGVFAVRSPRERTIEKARQAMLSRGLFEAWSTTMISEREALATAALLGNGDPGLVRVSNPLSRDGEVLRPSPVAGLMRACAHNLRQGASAVRLFEVGAGFRRAGAPGTLPEETTMVCAIVSGPRFAHAHDPSEQMMDFSDGKGLWEAWLEEMSVDTVEWRTYSSPGWKPGASAEVATATSRIAWAGLLGQELLRGWEIEAPVQLFVALLDPLASRPEKAVRARLPGRFPPARRDVAFFVPEAVTHRQVETALREAAAEWLIEIELFDVYTGTGTPRGMKSLAYALQFQHPERTLAEAEIVKVQERMATAVAQACGGRLREK